MVYICDRCHFEFERFSKEVEQCPDCGKQYCVRLATPEEASAYEKRTQALKKKDF